MMSISPKFFIGDWQQSNNDSFRYCFASGGYYAKCLDGKLIIYYKVFITFGILYPFCQSEHFFSKLSFMAIKCLLFNAIWVWMPLNVLIALAKFYLLKMHSNSI